jgi:transposase, IS5 family
MSCSRGALSGAVSAPVDGDDRAPDDPDRDLAYLKHRHDLGWETLCKEAGLVHVAALLPHRARRPGADPSTLMKLTERLGPELLEELNAELLSLAVELRVLRSRRLRMDTTVVEADIRSPDRLRAVRHAVWRLASLARADRGHRRREQGPHARVLAGQLERELETAERILAQTDLRLRGQRTIPIGRISLVDRDARPILMGNPKRPTEFGYKAPIADTAEGFVIAEVPQAGNPNDDRLLAGAIARAKDAGMRVDCVLADRGFGTRGGDQALREHEIKRAVIPRRGRAPPIEATRGWRRCYRFRNGLEGRVSQLKRKGLRRTR